jgi:hypothetical protein
LHGNVLRIAPAMSVTLEEAGEALEILIHALHVADGAVAQKGAP